MAFRALRNTVAIGVCAWLALFGQRFVRLALWECPGLRDLVQWPAFKPLAIALAGSISFLLFGVLAAALVTPPWRLRAPWLAAAAGGVLFVGTSAPRAYSTWHSLHLSDRAFVPWFAFEAGVLLLGFAAGAWLAVLIVRRTIETRSSRLAASEA